MAGKEMSEKQKLKAATAAYQDFCKMLDGRKWKYNRHDEDLAITTTAVGDDLSMELVIRFDADRQLVRLHSRIPVEVPEAMRKAMAIAVSRANHNMVDGAFDYDYREGKIYFRLTASFKGSILSQEALEYILQVSCNTIDDYNDKFVAIVATKMSAEQIADFIS